MRALTLLMLTTLAACAPAPVARPMTEQQAAAITRATMDQHLAPEQRLREALVRERLEESRAQSFGIEARMTRLAMACEDPAIRRVAYATADMQSQAFERLMRRAPRLAEISAAEETRLRNRTFGPTPSRAECRQLLAIMGQSAKAIRDGER